MVKVQGEWLQWYKSQSGIFGQLFHRESFTFSYEKVYVSHDKELLCAKMASQITAEMVSSLHSSPDLSCLFMHPNLLPNIPQWNNCSYLPLSVSHNTALIVRKCEPVCGSSWLCRMRTATQGCQII